MEIIVDVERIAYGGAGVGFLDGKVCFIEGALPKEKVRARVIQNKKKFLKAELLEIIDPSPDRAEPECPYYGYCGGCQYQHLDYEKELEWKEAQVRENLVRALRIETNIFKPIVALDSPYRYRNRVTLHETIKASAQSQIFGFVGVDNRSVMEIEKCLLVKEPLEEVFGKKILLKKGETQITYQLSEKNEIFADRVAQLFPVAVGKDSILTSTHGFFQNNLEITARVVAKINEWIEDVKPKTFIDLYAGVGTFSLLTNTADCKLVHIEESPVSLEALKENLLERKRESKVIEGKVEKMFCRYDKKTPSEEALVFLDPPRKGMEGEFCTYLSEKKDFKAIVYLSCHLGTLARDLKLITDGGNYEVTEITPFDMFPRTKHIEVAVLLKRKNL
jgi:23S rRNA (uracil1939-C5)-methyltransferase